MTIHSNPESSRDSRGDPAAAKAKLPFVLVHGAWHGATSYERVVPLLAARGHAAVARDLPAHGLNARFPVSYTAHPFDPRAFATEPSPVATTTLDDYANSIMGTIDQVLALGHSQVVLVGHSMGGVAITAVAAKAPQKIAKLVYLTAFMPRAGVPGISYITAPENQGERVGPQLVADPATVGALRINYRSADSAYRANVKLAFCADASPSDYEAMANLLTPDVPVAPFSTPIFTTAERWGSIPRYYIRCSQDQAILPKLQDRFIAEADEAVPENMTQVYDLDASHSPFLSMPQSLADVLSSIALD